MAENRTGRRGDHEGGERLEEIPQDGNLLNRRKTDEIIFEMHGQVGRIEEHLISVDDKVSHIDLKCIDLNGYKQRIINCEGRLKDHDSIVRNVAYVLIVVVLLGGIGFFASQLFKHLMGG